MESAAEPSGPAARVSSGPFPSQSPEPSLRGRPLGGTYWTQGPFPVGELEPLGCAGPTAAGPGVGPAANPPPTTCTATGAGIPGGRGEGIWGGSTSGLEGLFFFFSCLLPRSRRPAWTSPGFSCPSSRQRLLVNCSRLPPRHAWCNVFSPPSLCNCSSLRLTGCSANMVGCQPAENILKQPQGGGD